MLLLQHGQRPGHRRSECLKTALESSLTVVIVRAGGLSWRSSSRDAHAGGAA